MKRNRVGYSLIVALILTIFVGYQNCSKAKSNKKSQASLTNSVTLKVWQGVNLETGAVLDSGSPDDDVALIINPSLGITSVLAASGPAPDFTGYIKDFTTKPALPDALNNYQDWFGMIGIAEGDYAIVQNHTHDQFYLLHIDKFISGPNHTDWVIDLSWEPIQ